MLSKCQVLIADFQNIPIGTNKNLVPNFFDKKSCASLWKPSLLFEARIKTKKIYWLLEFNQLQWLKCNTKKIVETEKMVPKMGKCFTN